MIYKNLENIKNVVNESSVTTYQDDHTKQNLCNLIGEKATNKLYDTYKYSYNIINANAEDYKNAGLSDGQVHILQSAKGLQYYRDLDKVMSSLDAYSKFKHMKDYNEEHFMVLCLNRNNKIINYFELSVGGVSGTVVDTKILFRKALSVPRISAIILAHNHPSGNELPSNSDIDLTKKIKQCCNLLDLQILDHLIVSGEKYYSFADQGQL